ncbi:hypothetical protein DUNSADRAFT_17801 [Dunaliella salina]|uniref:Encoded protein n=1 Tax=Dunaliella salina TaxID=3046 RepID=A0ABQ7GZQ7_DUNSA|nr:hypothetical protein DUNSADRAFT_17801 [Dunaliella salina]|eukprot:KAF5840066.1 hypothetical protein DUNSADRAFT_17801 [Dunaliella salina]
MQAIVYVRRENQVQLLKIRNKKYRGFRVHTILRTGLQQGFSLLLWAHCPFLKPSCSDDGILICATEIIEESREKMREEQHAMCTHLGTSTALLFSLSQSPTPLTLSKCS